MWPVTHHSSSSSSSSDRRVENKKGARHREGRMMIKKRRRQKATLPYGDTKSIQHLIMARFNWPLTPLPRTAWRVVSIHDSIRMQMVSSFSSATGGGGPSNKRLARDMDWQTSWETPENDGFFLRHVVINAPLRHRFQPFKGSDAAASFTIIGLFANPRKRSVVQFLSTFPLIRCEETKIQTIFFCHSSLTTATRTDGRRMWTTLSTLPFHISRHSLRLRYAQNRLPIRPIVGNEASPSRTQISIRNRLRPIPWPSGAGGGWWRGKARIFLIFRWIFNLTNHWTVPAKIERL